MNEQKNLFTAIVLAILIMLGFEYFYNAPRIESELARQQELAQQMGQDMNQVASGNTAPVPSDQANLNAPNAMPTPQGAAPPAGLTTSLSREEALSQSPRVKIETPSLRGSLSLIGGRIDDLTLHKYRVSLDADSADVILLSPQGSMNGYFARYGWIAGEPATKVPGADTLWSADRKVLTPEAPLTLTWDNGQGLTFKRVITLDEDYMFTVTQAVENNGAENVSLFPYGLVSRNGTPETQGFFILHEGPIGVFSDTLKEVKYDDLRDERQIKETTTGGWIGITDKYWLVSLIPDQGVPVDARFIYGAEKGNDKYQVDILGDGQVIAPGSIGSSTSRLFAGAKVLAILDRYSEEYAIARFDLAVDFGWFYFMTKPIFYMLSWFDGLLGNFGLAILALTVVIRFLMYPLADKSFRSMNAMKKLTPEIKKLRERYTDDRAKMNQEMMAIYKREKVNPAAGCLPMFIQIPVFFSLYKVLFVSIEMRQAPFYGWIHDLSAPDPTTIFNLFGLIPWSPPQMLMFGVWPIAMGVTMYLQQKLNPPPADPIQAKVFMFLPFIFTILLASFPAGLVIYWAWNNTLSIAQQWSLMKRMEAPDEAEKSAEKSAEKPAGKTTEKSTGKTSKKTSKKTKNKPSK